MTDQTAQEPTMEEILASIRRIISEDEAPADVAPAAAAAVEDDVHETDAEADFESSPALMDETPSVQEATAPEEDVLELTDRYEEPAPAGPVAPDTMGDLDIGEPEPFPAEPEPTSSFRSEPVSAKPDYDALVGESAAASAASAFAGLAASMKPEPVASTAAGPTIDELARALLRPMLKEWLDANLPGIVEAAVRKEVERIARDGGR